MRNYKYFDYIMVFFIVVLLVSNIVSVKIVTIGSLTFDGGTILFPLSYIFGDILTEVYGYKSSRKVIWLGFFSALILSICIMVVGYLPASPEWNLQNAYMQILGFTPRIVLASLIAYFVGEFVNSYIMAKLKIFSKGKMLPVRTIGSTIFGQLFDSVIFITIAFYGVIPMSTLSTMIVSIYLFKVGFEVLFTPITFYVIGLLKKYENEDFYDYNTDFNPFSGK